MNYDDSELHIHFMSEALKLAEQASSLGEAPIGAVVVKDGIIVGRGFNDRESSKSVFGHAEARAIQNACETLGSWRLIDCTLYVTLEPCLMCSGAIVQSRMARVIYGAIDPKGGAVKSLFQTLEDSRLNHQCEVIGGVLAEECSTILRDFFKNLRLSKKLIE